MNKPQTDMPSGKTTKTIIDIYLLYPNTVDQFAKEHFDDPKSQHLSAENKAREQALGVIEELKRKGYIKDISAQENVEILELTDEGMRIVIEFDLATNSLVTLYIKEVLHLTPDTAFIINELSPAASDLLLEWLDEHDGTFPDYKEEKELLKSITEKVAGKKFRLNRKVDMQVEELVGRKIKTKDDYIWLFARQVTYGTCQSSDFEDYYEIHRNLRIGTRKLIFRGVGLDDNDEPVIRVMKRNGDYEYIPANELTDKDKTRVAKEIDRLAAAINDNTLLICAFMTTISKFAVISIIYNEYKTVINDMLYSDYPDEEPEINPRKAYLIEAGYTKTNGFAIGTAFKYKDVTYTIDEFSMAYGNCCVLTHNENGNENICVDLLDVEGEQFCKIVDAIEQGLNDARHEAIFRPRPETSKEK